MNKTYHNDQAHIAGQFYYSDDHTIQTARFAFFKINSYKLAVRNAAFGMNQQELESFIRSSLLNYTAPAELLAEAGYYTTPSSN
jgi:hypothetical protein